MKIEARKVKVVTMITEVVERISIIEIPVDSSNESVVKDIEGKISPESEEILDNDVFDISAVVTSIENLA